MEFVSNQRRVWAFPLFLAGERAADGCDLFLQRCFTGSFLRQTVSERSEHRKTNRSESSIQHAAVKRGHDVDRAIQKRIQFSRNNAIDSEEEGREFGRFFDCSRGNQANNRAKSESERIGCVFIDGRRSPRLFVGIERK